MINEPIKQISHFNYVGWDASYDYDNDMQNKLYKFQYICCIIRKTLRNTGKERRMQFLKTMAIPIPFLFRIVKQYGNETLTFTKKYNERQI